MKIKKEIIREKKVKRRREDACSTSYPSGNQVDGLPLVAVVVDIISLTYALKLHRKIVRPQNGRAISEFYRF